MKGKDDSKPLVGFTKDNTASTVPTPKDKIVSPMMEETKLVDETTTPVISDEIETILFQVESK